VPQPRLVHPRESHDVDRITASNRSRRTRRKRPRRPSRRFGRTKGSTRDNAIAAQVLHFGLELALHLLAAIILVFLCVSRSLHVDNALQIRITQSFLGVLKSVDQFFNALLVTNSLRLLATIQSVRRQLAHTRHCDAEKSKTVAKPTSAFNDADHDADESNQNAGPSRKELESSKTLICHVTNKGCDA